MSQPQPHISGSRTEALREKCRVLLQEIRNEFIVDTKWHLPFPTVPAAQLIYVPNRVRDIFSCPATTINQSDIDAMAFGILERLNLNYFASDPYKMKAVRDAVAAAEQKYEDDILDQTAKGLAINPLPKLSERYHNLEEADAELVEEDLGVHPLERDTLPSGTLMKNHIYTELGRTPLQRRAEMRLAAPFARFGLGKNNDNENNNNNNSTSGSLIDGGVAAGGSQASAFMMSLSQGSAANNNNAAKQQQETISAEERWVKQVNMSFKNAKQLDALFALYLDRVATNALGLVAENPQPGDFQTTKTFNQAQESVRAFTKQFLQLFLEIFPASQNLANKLAERVRSLVSGDAQVETAQGQLEEDWSFAANESEVLVKTAEIRTRFLQQSLSLFAEYELSVKEDENCKACVKYVAEKRQSFGSSTADGAPRQFPNFKALLQKIVEGINPRDPKRGIHLVNPDHPEDVPVAIIPIIPGTRRSDAPVSDLTARVLLNVSQNYEDEDDQQQKQQQQGGNNSLRDQFLTGGNSFSDKNRPYHPTVMFGNELLLRPDPKSSSSSRNGGNNNNNNRRTDDDVVDYLPESSAFEVLKENDDDDGVYLLKVGQDAARFARVPRTVEMIRKLGTEKPSSEIETSTVIWEDVPPPQ